jgi:Flp pilus assembly pilin Flp
MPIPPRHPPLGRPRRAAVWAAALLASGPTHLRGAVGRAGRGPGGRGRDDRGATAIEWAIFALLAIAIAGLVAAAITAAVNNRLPGIQ